MNRLGSIISNNGDYVSILSLDNKTCIVQLNYNRIQSATIENIDIMFLILFAYVIDYHNTILSKSKDYKKLPDMLKASVRSLSKYKLEVINEIGRDVKEVIIYKDYIKVLPNITNYRLAYKLYTDCKITPSGI